MSCEPPIRVAVSREQTVGAAIRKLARVLGGPGVNKAALFASDETPLFRAHPARPGLLIRSFRSGKAESGRITARGEFKVVSEELRR